MINDLVKKNDPQNQFEVLKNSFTQIEYAWGNEVLLSEELKRNVNNIIISGLGGSAISGDLVQNFLRTDLKLPLFINRGYSLPYFAGANTLVLVSSYSGNTEETIEVLKDALNRKCKIICLTTGGKVKNIAEENDLPVIKLKEGFQPRYALGVSFFTMLRVFNELKFIPSQDNAVAAIISNWEKCGVEYSKEGNYPLQIAEKILGFIPIVYSVSGFTDSVGNRLKCQFNENSKLHSFHNSYSELNHNEIVGWETNYQSGFTSKVITILDKEYHSQNLKRIKITSEMIEEKGVEIIYLESKLADYKERLLDLIYLVDWISYYTAILRSKDPSEIDYIMKLKNEL